MEELLKIISKVILGVVFTLLFFPSYSNVLVFLNNKPIGNSKTIFVKQYDTLCLKDVDIIRGKKWFEIIPEQLNYDISNPKKPYSNLIKYKIVKFNSEKTLILKNESVGTRYFGLFAEDDSVVKNGVVSECRPIALCYNNIFQIVVRKDDSYLGYLTELINTPFILPPLFVNGFGHQTDLRIGSDCAELAIYGRRREGYNVPYIGPAGITKYLDEIKTDSLFEGCIVHFGFQVSVLFKDNGIKGKLDKTDILIQSYENKACIIEYEQCDYYNFPYKPYKWKT
jgi:hypothetical protein